MLMLNGLAYNFSIIILADRFSIITLADRCKYILGVKSTTNSYAIYAELGRMKLQLHRHVNILKFLRRLESLNNVEPNRYVSKSFRFLSNDAASGRVNWLSEANNVCPS